MRRLLVLLGVLALVATGPVAPARAEDAKGATTTVRTLPPLAHFSFRYHSHTYVTGADGTAIVPRALATQSKQLVAVDQVIPFGNGREARFEKWYGMSKLASSHGGATAAFSVWNAVSFRFTNLEGAPVARSALGKVAVKSSTGYALELPQGSDTMPLQATRVVPDQSGLSVKDLYYTVQTVDVEGNNVVNRSQTKVVPRTEPTVTVPLLFFDATVQAKDTIFGRGVHGTLLLQYPNGHVREVPLDRHGHAMLPGLPRGQYKVSVRGPGLRLVQPVTMSRAQEVDLKVVTWLDLAVGAVALLAVAVGLILTGGALHRRRARREPEPVAEEPADLPPVLPYPRDDGPVFGPPVFVPFGLLPAPVRDGLPAP